VTSIFPYIYCHSFGDPWLP